MIGIILGLTLGSPWPTTAELLEQLLWPTLLVLLFATFVQMPLLQLRDTFNGVAALSAYTIPC